MTERRGTVGSGRVTIARKPPRRRSGLALTLFVMVLFLCSPRTGAAHETIDTERVNAILAATDAAASRAKSAAGSPTEAEAMFALGMMQVEATATLNRDLAAHSGRLTFNGESLGKALDQRHLAPRLRRGHRPLSPADGFARAGASPIAASA